jgi:GNAT superfamily N-acetyltransferase
MDASAQDMVTVFYLQMESPSPCRASRPPGDLSVAQIEKPSAELYRSLYDAVGENYNWRSRRKLSPTELEAIIQHPENDFLVLTVNGQHAGFAELDRRKSGDIEIVQFGLVPGFIGQGLGKWFLEKVLESAWHHQPRRIWLHTCTLDHAAALPNYLKAGFTLYKQEVTKRYV